MNYLKFSWDSVEKITDDVYHEIVKSYLPNYIISIGRGGLVPARILADRFNINDISIIDVKLYDDVHKQKNTIIIKPFNENIENKHVLLVDDICDSGLTIQNTIPILRTKKIMDLRTITLFCRESSPIKPSFVGKIVGKEWVIFPWEKNEFKHLTKEISNNEK